MFGSNKLSVTRFNQNLKGKVVEFITIDFELFHIRYKVACLTYRPQPSLNTPVQSMNYMVLDQFISCISCIKGFGNCSYVIEAVDYIRNANINQAYEIESFLYNYGQVYTVFPPRWFEQYNDKDAIAQDILDDLGDNRK